MAIDQECPLDGGEQRRRRKRAIAAVCGALTLVGGALVGLGGTASGADSVPTTTTVPASDAATASPAAASEMNAAINAELPDKFVVTEATSVRTDRAEYDDFVARLDDGRGYGVTVYYRFDESELKHLVQMEGSGGTVWVGAEDEDLTSVYYRSDSGVGLWVGYFAPDHKVADVKDLVLLAEGIAENPTIKGQVQR